MRLRFKLQLWMPNVVNMWLRHVMARWSRHVVTRHGKKRGCEFNEKKVITATMWDRIIEKTRTFHYGKRSPIGNHFSTTFVFAHDANRHSGTTLPPHVVTPSATSFLVHFWTSPAALNSLSKLAKHTHG